MGACIFREVVEERSLNNGTIPPKPKPQSSNPEVVGEHQSRDATIPNPEVVGEHQSRDATIPNPEVVGEHQSRDATIPNPEVVGEHQSRDATIPNPEVVGEHQSRDATIPNPEVVGEHQSRDATIPNPEVVGEHQSRDATIPNPEVVGEHQSRDATIPNPEVVGEHQSRDATIPNPEVVGEHQSRDATIPNPEVVGEHQSRDATIPPKPKPYSSTDAHDDLSNIMETFPMAYPHYRLEQVNSHQELVFFEKLQEFLKHKRVFIDDQNPVAENGEYVPANKIFEGKYFMFQTSESVIIRDKNRIGIAGKIEPKDIQQGEVGDCYFMSSIASIAQLHPEVISQKILFSENEAGLCVVRLFIDGEWQVFMTDERFPCRDNRPVFAKPHGKEIWVMLLEKCWAKSFGSYDKISHGSSIEAFTALTGAYADQITLDEKTSEEQVNEKLQQAVKHSYPATASGSKYLESLGNESQQALGLISNHSYSFLKFINADGQTLVNIRNPWGSTAWTGDWSFQSSKWTQHLRDRHNYHNKPEDGAFYMPWNAFIKYFTNFVICRLNPSNLQSSIKIAPMPHKSKYFCITVKQQGSYGIAVYQQNKRRIGKNYEYSSVRLILANKIGEKYQYVASINKSSSDVVQVESQLEPGVYYAAVKVEWQQQQRQCTLTVSGPDRVEFKEIDNSIAPSFKSDIVETYSRMRSGEKTYYNGIQIPQAYQQLCSNLSEGLGYLRLNNPSDQNFELTLTSSEMRGMKPIKPSRIPHTFMMQPRTEYIIGFWLSGKECKCLFEQSVKIKRVISS